MSSKGYDTSFTKGAESLSRQDNSPEESVDALKHLLFRPEKEQIQQIEARLDDPMVRAKEVSRLLPEALSLSLMSDNRISRIIQPVIDDTIKASVKNNPRVMAEALFPALGPGIRKAITSTIMGMIQSLNQVLNHSFSIQGLKWRFEAFKTGREFGEVVLLHTLVFKVEQIFLIHRESGIVLDHVVAEDTIIQDPDLVSGMLTAIQDFVNDSFQSGPGDDIQTLRIGTDRSVWIEKGEHALIASVIRGTPPVSLREQYRSLIDEIHIKSGSSLEKFDGDPFPFAVFREQLTDGLRSQEKTREKKTSPLIWCILILLTALAGFWGNGLYKDHRAWQNYLSLLESQKGLVILSVRKSKGVHMVSGFLDPLENDPATLIPLKYKKRINVAFSLRPYDSHDPDLTLERAYRVLAPPSSVRLELEGKTLRAKGEASDEWLAYFAKTAPAIAGIHLADAEGLVSRDQQLMARNLNRLAQIKLYFNNNSIQLQENQESRIDEIIRILAGFGGTGTVQQTAAQIVILGHTDSSGTETRNLRLSRERARKILDLLIIKGVNPAVLSLSGVGTKMPLKTEQAIADRQYNRAVSFRVFHPALNKGFYGND